MKVSTARVLSWSACVAALWLETAALLAWIDAPMTRGDVLLSAIGAGTLALLLATNDGKLAGRETRTGLRLVEFGLALALALVFVEIDCGGTLTFVGGHPACTDGWRGGLSVILTLAAVAACLLVWPNALRGWLLARLAGRRG